MTSKPLNDTQIKFLLRVQQGAVRYYAYNFCGARPQMGDTDGRKWSMNTLDAMIRRGWIALPGRMDDDRAIRLTADGARFAEGLRSSWPALAAEVA